MKVIIAGSRSITGKAPVLKAIGFSGFKISKIVSGTARGVDQFGELVAKDKNIPVKRFPADWGKHGKAAGFIRNIEMSEYADALIAVWDGSSKGTQHMIETMDRLNKPFYVYVV